MALPIDVRRILQDRGGQGRNGGLSGQIRDYCYARDDHRCTCCGIAPRKSRKGKRVRRRAEWHGLALILTIDHIQRREHLGSNHPRNLRTLCSICHDFLNRRGRLPGPDERTWTDLSHPGWVRPPLPW